MCGITGYWGSDSDSAEELEAVARGMALRMAHRGPDDSGEWVDPQAGVALSFRRLAIVDLSPAGHQPMCSASGRYVLIFNGEVYNFQALRQELASKGHQFRGGSDTEVMLAAFEEWGIAPAIQRFVGMFGLALWDRQARSLSLARDRLGIKPLYYGQFGGTFLFGSELKALRAQPAFRGEVARDALALYLRYSYIPAPWSIFEGVLKLPPGTILTVTAPAGELPAPAPYWSAKAITERGLAQPLAVSDGEAVDRLDALLREAIRLRMIADVPLGAFLSGGVDSSTVVALMQAQSERPVKTFTIGFREAEYNEAAHAAEVARHLGTDHTELYVTPSEAQAVIPQLPTIYDEPFGDSSQIPTFLVSRLARQQVTVSLSGDGGDELFGGYNRHFWGRSLWRRMRHIPTPMRRLGARTLSAIAPEVWDREFARFGAALPKSLRQRRPGEKLHKLAGVLAVGTPEEFYRGLVSQWAEPAEIVLGGRERQTLLTDPRHAASLPDFTRRMMYLDLISYLPDDILAKVDRASMAVSLEARVPLLDHRVVEFAASLPLEMKIRAGQGKWLLRRVLDRYVPAALIERPKTGFGVPIDQWLRGLLREWAEALLAEERLRDEGYFNVAAIRRTWAEHLSGARNWQHQLWGVLQFQAWSAEWGAAIAGQFEARDRWPASRGA